MLGLICLFTDKASYEVINFDIQYFLKRYQVKNQERFLTGIHRTSGYTSKG